MMEVCKLCLHALGRIRFTTKENSTGAKQSGLDHHLSCLLREQEPMWGTEILSRGWDRPSEGGMR